MTEINYIFGQVQWLMFVLVNFSVMFNAFGHIHSVILIRSSDYSSKIIQKPTLRLSGMFPPVLFSESVVTKTAHPKKKI